MIVLQHERRGRCQDEDELVPDHERKTNEGFFFFFKNSLSSDSQLRNEQLTTHVAARQSPAPETPAAFATVDEQLAKPLFLEN